MKNFKFFLMAFAALVVLALPAGCDPTDDPEKPVIKDTYSFDLFVCAVKHGGMSKNKNGTFVRSVSALTADQPRVEFTGKGVDITENYTLESITRGRYYYQVPQRATGGFVKFHIERDATGAEKIVEDAEVPFKDKVYSARKYTHAWIGDSTTLVIVGTADNATKIQWTKLSEKNLMVELSLIHI